VADLVVSVLIPFGALGLTGAVTYLIVGNPLVDRVADRDTLTELTRKDHL